MTEALGFVAAAAVLFALGLRGIRWLYVNATWWRPPQRAPQVALTARYLPAIRSHPAASGVPQALPSGPQVLEGKVVERKVER